MRLFDISTSSNNPTRYSYGNALHWASWYSWSCLFWEPLLWVGTVIMHVGVVASIVVLWAYQQLYGVIDPVLVYIFDCNVNRLISHIADFSYRRFLILSIYLENLNVILSYGCWVQNVHESILHHMLYWGRIRVSSWTRKFIRWIFCYQGS